MSDLTTGYEWTNGATVTAARLNAAIEAAVLKGDAISGKSELAAAPASGDFLLLWDASANGGSGGLVKISQANLLGLLVPGVISGQAEKSALVDADTFLIWDSEATALKKITRANLIAAFQPAGTVLQTVYAEYKTATTLSDVIPFDDTIPQSSEGTEIFSVAITPQSASNKILVQWELWAARNSGALVGVSALFRDSGTDAIAAAAGGAPIQAQVPGMIMGCFLDSPATVSEVTYKLRVGPASGTFQLNGSGLERKFGGTGVCTFSLQEIKG